MGSHGIEDRQQGGGWRTGRARQLGSETDFITQGSRAGK